MVLKVQFNEKLIYYESNRESFINLLLIFFFIVGLAISVMVMLVGGYFGRMVIGVEPYDFFFIKLTCLTLKVEVLPADVFVGLSFLKNIVGLSLLIFFMVKFLRSTA